jgi:hypothetical protein
MHLLNATKFIKFALQSVFSLPHMKLLNDNFCCG